jgi:hypothetical protein
LLEAAFNTVIERHEALRSSVDPVTCTQTVHARAALRVACQDFSALDDASRETAVREWKARQAQSGFDLSQPPLLHVSVARMGNEDHILHVTVHHTVCDGLSLAQILQEVSDLYRGRNASALPPSRGLAQMLRDDAAGPSNAHGQAYWRRQLDSPAAWLPRPAPAPGIESGIESESESAGSRMQVELPAALTQAVKAAARSLHCTPFVLMCAAYLKLLAGQTRSRDLLVGIPFLRITPTPNEARVGCFVELMPLRAGVEPTDDFRQLAGRVKELMLLGYQHASAIRELPSAALCATFNFEPRVLPESFGHLAVAYEPARPRQIEFDLMLNVTQTWRSLIVKLDYRHRTLSTGQAAQWLEDYVDIIETGCAQAAGGSTARSEREPVPDTGKSTTARTARRANQSHDLLN